MPVPAITPGTYLRRRREAAGLAIGDVAARLATVPRIAEHARAEWIAAIEAGTEPASWHTIVALRCAFAFDLAVAAELAAAELGEIAWQPPICRSCCCSEHDACAAGCFWAGPDLCSACVDPVAQVSAIHAAAAGEPGRAAA